MIPTRRLEDKVRELCARVAEASNGDLDAAIAEVQIALSEHALRVENKISATVLAWPEFPRDRRRA